MEGWRKDGRREFVVDVEVTAGNVHDSIAWDALYAQVTQRLPQTEFITMDSAYKTPWIMKKILDDGRIPIIPYTRYKGKKDAYKPWMFTYDEGQDCFICPQGCQLRHTTTDKNGKRFYRSMPKDCRNCPYQEVCGANAKGQRTLTTHIWQEYLDLAEQLRKTTQGKEIYQMRKETIERVFADAKKKHAMRYTHHRGLTAVTRWVRLKYAAMRERPEFCVTTKSSENRAKIYRQGGVGSGRPLYRHLSGSRAACQGIGRLNPASDQRNRQPVGRGSYSNPGAVPSIFW